MRTQDSIKNDTFEVYLELKDEDREYLILKTGYTGSDYGQGVPGHIITGRCDIDLTNPTDCNGNALSVNFLCSEIHLRFENWNRNHTWYNTYTYVDDVQYGY
jgi:hypothetical protein